MISLEQVRQLDIRVRKAVSVIRDLTEKNEELKQQITALESRLEQLDAEASGRQADEQQIEVGLQGVLDVLDEVEMPDTELPEDPKVIQADTRLPESDGSDPEDTPSVSETVQTEPEEPAVTEPESGQKAEISAESPDEPEPESEPVADADSNSPAEPEAEPESNETEEILLDSGPADPPEDSSGSQAEFEIF